MKQDDITRYIKANQGLQPDQIKYQLGENALKIVWELVDKQLLVYQDNKVYSIGQ